MGARLGRVGRSAVALVALVCTGFSGGIKLAGPAPSTPTRQVTAPPPASEGTSAPVPYREPGSELRAIGGRFVTTALGYDSSSEGRRDFLGQMEDLATKRELARVRRSERAHLN
jgi:hypothetical protein